MSTNKNIENSLFKSEKIYSPTFISKLSNIEKRKLHTTIKEESSYLILLLYILLILFVSITLIIILKGDKNNSRIPNKFYGDANNKKSLSIWNKLYYIIFGSYIKQNPYSSNTNHLECSRSNYPVNTDIQSNTVINTSSNDKYKYLETFNVLSNNVSNSINEYFTQFEESRKCLINNSNNNSNTKNNIKYSYLANTEYSNLDLD